MFAAFELNDKEKDLIKLYHLCINSAQSFSLSFNSNAAKIATFAFNLMLFYL